MTLLVQIAAALALVFVAAVLAELPPMQAATAWIQEREWPLAMITGGMGLVGFTLMMGGILKLLMDQDRSLSDTGDVARSVRLAPRPVTRRASSYRGWGRAADLRGSEQFTFAELKQAWKSGAVWEDTVWKRRFVTSVGAFMMVVGLLGAFVVIGPPWLKVLTGGAGLYAMSMAARGLWKT